MSPEKKSSSIHPTLLLLLLLLLETCVKGVDCWMQYKENEYGDDGPGKVHLLKCKEIYRHYN